jgi:hypothetical protein
MYLRFETRFASRASMRGGVVSKVLFLFFIAAVLACGGKAATSVSIEGGAGGVEPTAGPGGAAGDDGGAQSSGGGPVDVAGGAAQCGSQHAAPNPKSGRPKAMACPSTPLSDTGLDGGIVQCKSDADCSRPDLVQFCFKGVCGSDQCLTDSDCGEASACRCIGDALPDLGGNECVPAQCRVNSDCGPEGVCAPSFSDSCGLLVDGYHCRSVADTCNDEGDCCKSSPSCLFQPGLGHWSCQPRPVCVAG